MEKLTCPKCGANYSSTKRCTSKLCILSFIPAKEKIDWSHLLYRATHIDWKDIRTGYRKLKNRLFIRHDLVRTGVSKWGWCDKDYLMERAMHQLVIDYVEKEEGLKYHHTDKGNDEHFGDYFKDINQKVLDVYIDIKVTLPMMEKVNDDLLTKWADSSHWHTDFKTATEEVKDGERFTFPSRTKTPEAEKNWKALQEHEDKFEAFKTQLLHRIVDIRQSLWT
jgi:hypothetical protein